MASRSRWAAPDEEDGETVAQRRRAKEEKKRLKEEKQRQGKQSQQAPAAREDDDPLVNGESNRPAKRQRLENDSTSNIAVEEGSSLLHFPAIRLSPCRDVELYELLNNIEEGSYGFVSRARQKESGDIVALKRLKMEHNNDGFPVTALREIQTLMACRHSNIVALREVVMGATLKDIYLVMDFLEHDLKTLLDEMREPFLPSETKTLVHQLASGISFLHDNYVLHRDLKTSNLLLNNRGELKIADFGMARYTSFPPPSNLTQLVVTLWYRAPELLLGTPTYDASIDIWSLGCVFAELLTREPLFKDARNEIDMLSRIFSLLGTPTNDSWPAFRTLPNAKVLTPLLSKPRNTTSIQLTPSTFPHLTASGFQLLTSMMSLNPTSRVESAVILRHPYFSEQPHMKPKKFFPTFPSKAGQERRRKIDTPHAPVRGQAVPQLKEDDLRSALGGLLLAGGAEEEEQRGAGFALKFKG